MTIGRRAAASALFVIGQAVIATKDNEQFSGVVKRFKSGDIVRIHLDSGGFANFDKSQLAYRLCDTEGCGRKTQSIYRYCDVCLGLNVPVKEEEQPDIEKKGGKEMSFIQYLIDWKKRPNGKKPRNFTCDTNDIHFYGWWRKTKVQNTDEITWAIDIFAKRTGQTYSIEPIYYTENPLKNYKSLNADICAAMNKFMHQTLNGEAHSLDTLQAKARFPVLKIKRIATIDKIILSLREIRDTGIRAGGTRYLEIHGDADDGPTVRFIVDLTMQAIITEGKPPPIEGGAGAMFDGAKKGERHGHRLAVVPQKGNVEDLVKELKKAKEADNKPLQRKLRAIMRKMGHRGASRTIDKSKK